MTTLYSKSPLPDLYTPEFVAERWGCDIKTIARERKRKRLGFLKIAGNKVRFTVEQILDYEALCTTTSVNEKKMKYGKSAGPSPVVNLATVALARGIARKPTSN